MSKGFAEKLKQAHEERSKELETGEAEKKAETISKEGTKETKQREVAPNTFVYYHYDQGQLTDVTTNRPDQVDIKIQRSQEVAEERPRAVMEKAPERPSFPKPKATDLIHVFGTKSYFKKVHSWAEQETAYQSRLEANVRNQGKTQAPIRSTRGVGVFGASAVLAFTKPIVKPWTYVKETAIGVYTLVTKPKESIQGIAFTQEPERLLGSVTGELALSAGASKVLGAGVKAYRGAQAPQVTQTKGSVVTVADDTGRVFKRSQAVKEIRIGKTKAKVESKALGKLSKADDGLAGEGTGKFKVTYGEGKKAKVVKGTGEFTQSVDKVDDVTRARTVYEFEVKDYKGTKNLYQTASDVAYTKPIKGSGNLQQFNVVRGFKTIKQKIANRKPFFKQKLAKDLKDPTKWDYDELSTGTAVEVARETKTAPRVIKDGSKIIVEDAPLTKSIFQSVELGKLDDFSFKLYQPKQGKITPPKIDTLEKMFRSKGFKKYDQPFKYMEGTTKTGGVKKLTTQVSKGAKTSEAQGVSKLGENVVKGLYAKDTAKASSQASRVTMGVGSGTTVAKAPFKSDPLNFDTSQPQELSYTARAEPLRLYKAPESTISSKPIVKPTPDLKVQPKQKSDIKIGAGSGSRSAVKLKTAEIPKTVPKLKITPSLKTQEIQKPKIVPEQTTKPKLKVPEITVPPPSWMEVPEPRVPPFIGFPRAPSLKIFDNFQRKGKGGKQPKGYKPDVYSIALAPRVKLKKLKKLKFTGLEARPAPKLRRL